MNNKYTAYNSELSFLGLIRILLSKKWWFIATFIIIVIASFAYLFLRPAEYTVNSKIRISESYIGSNNSLYDYFPEDAEELWIFPTHRRNLLEDENLDRIVSELRSSKILGKIVKDQVFDLDKVKSEINIIKVEETDDILISTTFNNPEGTLKVNKSLLGTYLDYKRKEFEDIYNTFLLKISDRVNEDWKDIESLTSEKGKNDAEYRIEASKPVDERDADYIGERLANIDILNREIGILDADYRLLLKVKNNLEVNKEFFINRIEIVEEPYIDNITVNASFKKNAIYSVITAIIIAFILTFIIGIASYSRYINRH